MTDQEINIAIAEACGWGHLTQFTNRITDPNGNAIFFNPMEKDKLDLIPNYCHDLNAMSEVEASIYGDLHFLYVEKLVSVTQCDPEVVGDEWCLIHASARQRAEAFLRTLGRWVDKDQTK